MKPSDAFARFRLHREIVTVHDNAPGRGLEQSGNHPDLVDVVFPAPFGPRNP